MCHEAPLPARSQMETLMKATRRHMFIVAALVGAFALHAAAFAQSTHWDELGALSFPENYPTPEASARLYDELQFQRACQVYLWALPAMNMVAMRDGQAAAFGAGNNVLVISKDRLNAKTIVSTGNPDVIHGLAFVDLKDGPLVFDAPPQMQGLLDDFWHRPLTDIGAAGPDQGKGGKFLSLGMEKGKPFNPDARMKKILTDATLVGEAMAKV